jgi:anaerobic selenocysteine-containing dehydrogenase
MSTPTATPHTVTVRGACPHDCPDTCALLTTVQDGVAIKVQGDPAHAQTGGVLCTKVSRYTERTYHPDRVLHPLKRVGPKGAGQFVRVSWDEVLADIAQRLADIAARDPEAILPYSYAGTMGLVQGESMDRRFFHQLGASLLDRTICASAGGMGLVHSIGAKVGMKVEQFVHSRLILIWGGNPVGSSLHFWRYAQEAKRRGARLVCIDPRRTETAEKCHQHIALRPGTDAALALAMMHELITHDWLDHDYIAQHTTGWPALRERALQWTPERAAEVCGIEADVIRELAQAWGTTRPAAIRLNYGMQRTRGGGNAVRAVACLPALTGAWRDAAGGLMMSASGHFPVQRDALARPDLLGTRQPRSINMSTIGDALLGLQPDTAQRPIEALIVYNSNPLAVAPESAKVARGLMRDDLFTVVLEHFMTDTADLADYVLPATTQLEHWDVHASYGHTDVLLNRPAIAPVGEARPNTAIFRALAQRMGPAWGLDHPCFADDDEALCRQAYGEAIDFEHLLAHGHVTLPVPDAPFAQGGFPTPSGRFEFFSERLAAQGLDGLPDFLPNHETPQPGDRYPLAMISPPARHFLNSSFANLKSLRDIERTPVLEIHPDDAAPRGIHDGDPVRVFNDRGDYHCTAVVGPRARPGVVNGLGIWWRKDGANGTNVNELTSQRLTDLGQAPTFYDCAVEVARL